MKWISKPSLTLQAILFTFILLVNFGCSKAAGLFSAQGAPGSRRNTNKPGLIASCVTPSRAATLAKNNNFQYRIINEQAGLVEFYNVSKEKLSTLLPNSKLTQNQKIHAATVNFRPGSITPFNVGNYQYYGPHNAQYRTTHSASMFPYLAQIGADNLNNYNRGEGVVIAVIDTGVYYNHPHLSPNIKYKTSDAHGNMADGVDNDNNGYPDDYVGWDFFNNDAYPIDDHGHGTHVAGLAASTYNGVAQKAKIMPIKVLNQNGEGDLGTIVQGILYAVENGAHIINMSLGGPGNLGSSDIKNLISKIKQAKNNNVLVVAASGNGGFDGIGDCNDEDPMFPSSVPESNVISVASVNMYNQMTIYSNYGKASVHIAAPGGDPYTDGGLLSTAIPYCPNGQCGSNTIPLTRQMGTSMATPIVAGVLALIKSQKPDWNYEQIKGHLFNYATPFNDLANHISTGAVVNASHSLLNL